MPVVVIGSDKGGTAKTTTAANLASALHGDTLGGASVCAIDCDPQGNLTTSFGLDGHDGPYLEHWLRDPGHPGLEPAVTPSGVSVIPSSPEQADVAATLMTEADGGLRLRRVCNRLAEAYDWIILDPPPGTAPMSNLAMLAADALIVTAAATDLDIAGAIGLFNRVEDGEFDTDDHVMVPLGILIVRTRPRRILKRQAYDAITRSGFPVLPMEIPEQERVGGHPRTGRPTIEIEPDGRVAAAYRSAAKWLLAEHAKASA